MNSRMAITHIVAPNQKLCLPPQNCCYAFMGCMKSWHPDWNFWARALYTIFKPSNEVTPARVGELGDLAAVGFEVL